MAWEGARPARRGQYCIADITERFTGSVLASENKGSRGRDPSPLWANHILP